MTPLAFSIKAIRIDKAKASKCSNSRKGTIRNFENRNLNFCIASGGRGPFECEDFNRRHEDIGEGSEPIKKVGGSRVLPWNLFMLPHSLT